MSATSYRAVFRSWFGLTDAEGEILVALYGAAGVWLCPGRIGELAKVEPRTVKQHVLKLRQALDDEAIDCERGAGYRLTEGGMGECRAVLWKVGEELRRAS